MLKGEVINFFKGKDNEDKRIKFMTLIKDRTWRPDTHVDTVTELLITCCPELSTLLADSPINRNTANAVHSWLENRA